MVPAAQVLLPPDPREQICKIAWSFRPGPAHIIFVAVDQSIGRQIQGRPNRSENERRQARSSFCAIDRRGQHGPGWD